MNNYIHVAPPQFKIEGTTSHSMHPIEGTNLSPSLPPFPLVRPPPNLNLFSIISQTSPRTENGRNSSKVLLPTFESPSISSNYSFFCLAFSFLSSSLSNPPVVSIFPLNGVFPFLLWITWDACKTNNKKVKGKEKYK